MERTEVGRIPVSADNPAGQDIKYDSDYEALCSEINKLSSPSAMAGIDWAKVVSLGENILRGKSKNLTVCCYLTIGLLQTDGLHGLADGLQILRDLLDIYWDSMYPPVKRKNARLNTLDWWNDKLQFLLRNHAPEKWDEAAVKIVQGNIEAIDRIITDKLEQGPALSPLLVRTSDLLVSGDVETTVFGDVTTEAGTDKTTRPPESKEPLKGTTPASPVPSTQDKPAAGAEDALVYFNNGLDYLSTSATLFFNRDRSDFLAYRLNRIIAWFEIETLPPAVEGKTMLAPPDSELQALLAGLYESSNWQELLQAAETRVREYLFWLDIHFWVFSALDNLHYDTAARAVADDTLLFVNRLRGLENCTFSDDTPFAGNNTRAWLEAKASQASGAETAAATAPPGSGQLNDEILQMATQLADEKGQAAMLSYVQDKIAGTVPVRDRFSLYLLLCRLLMKQKNTPLLLPFADKIMTLVDRYHLEQWEPDLALQAMTLAYQCMARVDRIKNEEKLDSLFVRITLLNAQKGLEII